MNNKITICEIKPDDLNSLKILYDEAFPDEDLFPLVTKLFNDKRNTLMLGALDKQTLVGHVAFTKCYVLSNKTPLSLLGPIAVLPSYQRKGIGNNLIKKGIKLLEENNVGKLLVLGDPNYYKRLGFVEEQNIQPAYPILDEWKAAWQSITLENSSTIISGKLNVTEAWQKQELWS